MDINALSNSAVDLAIARMRNELRLRRDSTRRRALADHVSSDQITAFLDFLDVENDRILAIAEKHLRPLCQRDGSGLSAITV